MTVLSRSRPWLRLVLAACALALSCTACMHTAPRHVAQHRPDPNILWHIVHDRCVPSARKGHLQAPCVEVSLARGLRDGYAVIKDIRGVAQYLVLPTARIRGIETPRLLAPDAPDYLADAWRARTWVEKALGRKLPRGETSLAINSIDGRSQNQLHIHVDCIRGDVRQALNAMLPDIGEHWSRLPRPLAGHPYRAMRLVGRRLERNPVKLLARSLHAGQSMGRQTLVVVGQRFADGRPGFLLLAGQSDVAKGNYGSGEELQDHQCRKLAAPRPPPPLPTHASPGPSRHPYMPSPEYPG